MELRINIDYNQILSLINQLPVDEIEKLTSILQTELSTKKKHDKKNLNKLIISAPTWTKADYDEYMEVRNYINKTRLV